MAARHTAWAQDCEYDIAWTNTYLVGIDYLIIDSAIIRAHQHAAGAKKGGLKIRPLAARAVA